MPADDQGPFAATVGLGGNPGVLLRGQRRLYELPQQRFGQIRRNAEPRGRVSPAQNHLAFPSEVAGGTPRGPLDRRHLFAERLPARDQFHQLSVQIGQCGPQFIEIHVVKKSPVLVVSVLLAARGYRKRRSTDTILK